MPDPIPNNPDDPEERDVADASRFLEEDDEAPEAPKRTGPDPDPAPAPDDDEETYDLAEPEDVARPTIGEAGFAPERKEPASAETYEPVEPEPEPEPEPKPKPPSPPERPASGAEAPAEPSPRRPRPEPEITPSEVDQPWSRLAEWGPALARISAAGLATLVVLYLMISAGAWKLAALAAFIGLIGLLLLSYPIAVTLERPVRMTPEQAVRDYYTAASLPLPHYRRMWLLLSNAGRSETQFETYSEFRAYWEKQRSELRGGRKGLWPRLEFQVEEFEADASAGKSAVSARYTVTVVETGGSGARRLHSGKRTITLSRGPDRMWYLDRGLPPE